MEHLTEDMLPDEKQYRFWRILLPDIHRMEEQLRAEGCPVMLADTIWSQLDLLLLKRLHLIAQQPLLYLQKQIAAEQNALAAYGLELIPQEQQDASLKELLHQAEAPDFFAVQLSRCRGYLDRTLTDFVRYIRVLFVRVAEQKAEIEAQLLDGRCFTQITKIVSDAGDLHNHGQTTALITTDAGTFVYKPHAPGIDGLMREMTQRWFSDTMRVPQVVAGSGYGFHEYIDNRPAATVEEAEAFYTHLGGQCAVFQMLGSYDLHMENFLALGDMPVPIDLETMLAPQARYGLDSMNGDRPAFFEDIDHSLFGSAILPFSMEGTQFSILMNDTERNPSAPNLDGKRTTVLDYEEAFLRGFRTIYHRCMAHREALAAFLHDYPAVPVRKVMHNTSGYMKLLLKLYSFREKSKHDDLTLLKQILGSPESAVGIPDYATIAACEAESIQSGNVPYFYTMSNGVDLMCEGRIVYPAFMKSCAIDQALKRLKRMSETEMNFEIRLFQEAFHKMIRRIKQPPTPQRRLGPNVGCVNLLEEAEQVFRQLDADSVLSPGGGVNWMALNEQAGMVMPLNVGLCSGLTGILLFLSALQAKTEKTEIRTKAIAYCNEILSLHEYFIDGSVQHRDLQSIDFAAGTAGILLGLCLANEHLHDARCDVLIQKRMQQLRELPEGKQLRSDFMTGMAGLVHVLCRLPLRDEGLIRRFADQLLEKRNLDTKLGFKIWNTIDKPRGISGVGHGQAGIGAALWSAWQVLGEEKYRLAALDCFRWEHLAFDERLGTWPDLREITAKPVYMHGFCSGAPGIGMALLGCDGLRDALDTYDQDMQRALDAAGKEAPLDRDHLCCGNMAAIEFLLTYGRRMHSDAALKQAEDRMAECLAHREETGKFQFSSPGYQATFVQDLFYGISGIGYTLLRMMDEEMQTVLLG